MEKLQASRPSFILGAIIGAFLTAPLIAIFYLGDAIAGLPFIPLDTFDWLARALPGGLITFGIDTMSGIIIGIGLGDDLSSVAKTVEISIGLFTFFMIGVVASATFFFIINRQRITNGTALGMILGIIIGVPLLFISNLVNVTATADPTLSLLWGLVVFIGWGAAIGWLYQDLRQMSVKDESIAKAELIGRRQFLIRVGGATATLTIIGAGLGALFRSRVVEEALPVNFLPTTDGSGNTLPNSVPGNLEPAPGTRPEYTPLERHYRIDISSRPPVIDAETWRLKISGFVENSVELSLEQLMNDFEPVSYFVTLSCISNRIAGSLISTTKWTGVPMQQIIDLVKPSPSATAMRITSADGFDEYLMLDLVARDERIMLAYAWDDQPLKEKHGFPLRIWIPDRYGMKQPKWITEIEFVDAWAEGYWVRRGWSKEAIVRTTSVIDTVASDSVYEAEGQWVVPIGGIAYAGARGISKVQVRVNGGEWQDAQLRAPLSETTWVIWRYDWPFEEGSHQFEVRCQEGDGTPQIEAINPNRPDGATGIHSRIETVAIPVTDASDT